MVMVWGSPIEAAAESAQEARLGEVRVVDAWDPVEARRRAPTAKPVRRTLRPDDNEPRDAP